MRERLPNRRGTITTTVRANGARLHVSFGCYEDGRLAEIFAVGPKIGSDVRLALTEAVTSASYALQHGASPSDLLGALPRDAAGKPEGLLAAILSEWESIRG